MVEPATLLFFPGLMAYAAFSDLFTMTISNVVSIALISLFLFFGLAYGLTACEILWHFASGVLLLAIGFALFVQGWIGGGDAKLAAATAVWLGFDRLGEYALVASFLGGVLALLILGLRQWPMLVLSMDHRGLVRLHHRDAGVPYGIALASAGLLLYPGSAIWLAAAAAG